MHGRNSLAPYSALSRTRPRVDRTAHVPALWVVIMAGEDFDRELEDLPPELRWREWMGRIEAVLFASASPIGGEDLARVVGQGASVEMLINDIKTELVGRPYELARVAGVVPPDVV